MSLKHEGRGSNPAPRTSIPICEQCDKSHKGFYGSGRFCSSKCSHQFSSNMNRLETNEKIGNTLRRKGWQPVLIDWATFGERIRVGQAAGRLLKDAETKATVPFEKWPKRLIRIQLVEELGLKCQDCGYNWVTEQGKGPYQLHHINGDHDDWHRENLTILCMNCHWKTDNWGFRNRFHSEESRKLMSPKLRKVQVA